MARRWPTSTRAASATASTPSRPSTSSTARRTTCTMFDPSVGFFQGRDADGDWRLPPEEYDPREWGDDYTETNGWNFAFTAPHDGQGLANLYGGRDELATKLDKFFATPETAPLPRLLRRRHPRDDRGPRRAAWASTAHSNQPSHHIPYMYDYAGQPAKTQALVREITVPAVPGQRDRPGLSRRRGQRRDVGVVAVQLARLLPAADGQPDLRDRLAAVHQGHREPGERQEAGHQGAEEHRTQRLRAGPEGRRQARTTRRSCRTPCSPTAAPSSSTWARSRRRGGPAPTPSTRR